MSTAGPAFTARVPTRLPVRPGWPMHVLLVLDDLTRPTAEAGRTTVCGVVTPLGPRAFPTEQARIRTDMAWRGVMIALHRQGFLFEDAARWVLRHSSYLPYALDVLPAEADLDDYLAYIRPLVEAGGTPAAHPYEVGATDRVRAARRSMLA